MFRARILSLLVLISVTVAPMAAWQPGRNTPLTNKDIVSLVANRVPEAVILKHIAANQTNFDVSTGGLIRLEKAGVSRKIIEAMQTSTSASQPATPVSSTPSGSQPAVFLLKGSSKVPVQAEATKIAQTKAKAKSLLELAKDQAILDAINAAITLATNMAKGQVGQQMAGVGGDVARTALQSHQGESQPARQMYVWALEGPGSATNLTGSPLNFEVSYAGIPGVNAAGFEPVIVKLSVAQGVDRLVGATEATADATQADWPIYSSFIEDRVSANVTSLGEGRSQIVPKAALPAGQYAVALRPKKKSHKFAGQDVANNRGEGLLFNYAWPFAVN